MFRYRWVAAGVLTAAAAVLTASIIGDRSATDYGDGLDYLIRPIAMSRELGVAVVLASIVGYAAAASYFLRFAPKEDSQERWVRAWALLTFAGIVLGIAYRMVTAGEIGANIGGGFVFWAAMPVSAYLIGRAAKGLVARPATDHGQPDASA